jgi:hypothetical protein
MFSGCFPADPAPSQLDVLNETGSSIWLDDDPANVESARDEVPPGAYGSVLSDGCSTTRIEAQDERGAVIATLDSEWCPGQMWVISGEDDWTLNDPR